MSSVKDGHNHPISSYGKTNEAIRKVLHLFAGGIGATVGQTVTCPLDVVQTRLQSTYLSFTAIAKASANPVESSYSNNGVIQIRRPIFGFTYFQILYAYMKHMVQTEGPRSLFKGLTPSLIGIVPAKAVYFFCYANVKAALNNSNHYRRDSHTVHTLSAMAAGSVTGTVTNPIWYIKTRLQLRSSKKKITIIECIKSGYQQYGFRAFFRGLSASYVGVLETVVYFLIYEDLKKKISETNGSSEQRFDAIRLILASLTSKLAATAIMYPHEVVRTRLREDTVDASGRLKYRNFVQVILLLAREEGRAGLYGGFATNLVRQLPNTSVTFLVYEAIVYFLEHSV